MPAKLTKSAKLYQSTPETRADVASLCLHSRGSFSIIRLTFNRPLDLPCAYGKEWPNDPTEPFLSLDEVTDFYPVPPDGSPEGRWNVRAHDESTGVYRISYFLPIPGTKASSRVFTTDIPTDAIESLTVVARGP